MNISTKIKSLLMGAVASVGLLSVAAPSVEIVEAWQETPGSGVANYTYQVSDIGGKAYDLQLKVGAKGATPQTVTIADVGVGAVTTNIDYKALLGHAHPNVTLYASLCEKGSGGVSGVAVQLWENGPYWAARNIGATKPEEFGYYFMWGGTVGYEYVGGRWKAAGGSSTISFAKAYCPTFNKSEVQLKSSGVLDASGSLSAAYDAATVALGADWRMPTVAEITALTQKCTTTWTADWNGTGVAGRIFTGKGDYAGNSIFLPAAGCGENSSFLSSGELGAYWSSGLADTYRDIASRVFSFSSSSVSGNTINRYFGYSVRPVRNTAE